jgi:hypothetical protein
MDADMEAWTLIWIYGHMDMVTWKLGNMETWKLGNVETWKHGNMET